MFVQQNTVKAIADYYHESLGQLYPKEEIDSLLSIVFEHFRQWSKIELRMNMNQQLSESELLEFHQVLKRLKKAEPIQHILGETEFYGLPFKVTSDVLIPRQETEELVDLVLKNCKGKETIVDIGTGSGIIPVTLKKNLPNADVFATDVSNAALKIAKYNAELNCVDVKFVQNDILLQNELNFIGEKVDIIISNPPYITQKEKENMHENVLKFDPEIALFVENESPLIFYKKITQLADISLSEGGQLFFEINEHFGNETKNMIQKFEFRLVELIKDLNGKDRIIHAIK